MVKTNVLKSKMVLKGDDAVITKLAELLGISRVTAAKKIKGEALFDQNEIMIIMKEYNLTPEEIVDIFLSDGE